MSMHKLIAVITGFRPAKSAATMNYEDIFKGSATYLPNALGKLCFPSGPCLQEQDPDTYFKEVFAGPLL